MDLLLRRRMMMLQSGGGSSDYPMPSEYQKVEYVGVGVKGAHIDTGYIPHQWEASVRARMKIIHNGDFIQLGCRIGGNRFNPIEIYYGNIAVGYGEYIQGEAMNSGIINIESSLGDGAQSALWVNEVSQATGSITGSKKKPSGSLPSLWIFDCNGISAPCAVDTRVYSMQIYAKPNYQDIVRNFEPCYLKSDPHIIGLWDRCNGEFHQGVGTLSRGVDVN